MIKFDLEAKGEDTYYLHCYRKGTEIKGLYMVSAETFDIDPIISIFVTDPSGKFVHSKRNKSLGRFSFETTMPGEYKFVFSNLKNKDEKFVTLSLHNQEEKEQKDYMLNQELDLLKTEGNEDVRRSISEISRSLNNITANSDKIK